MEAHKKDAVHQNNTQGYLRRAGKTGPTIGLRRKRFYKLHGAILSKHATADSEATWDVNIQGSDIVKLGKTHFVLSLAQAGENVPAHDFDQNTLILHSKTEQECSAWVSSLKYAANRKLENHYEVGRLIGQGGFAKVRLGRCILTGEPRAIKTMKKSDNNAKLLGTEVAIIKRVNHPNIVKTFDVYETADEIHIVMEFMEGGMLYEAIEHGVRFKEVDMAQFMREILDGVYYLHQHGIVHRDIKPENVLCTSRKVPLHLKIADFGLSSIADIANLRANHMIMSTMTGTPEFIAPEIANREEYTAKVDVWALGMLCYNVICGKLPLDEDEEIIPQLRRGISLTFPEPEWEMYSSECKSFLKALLCATPEKRLTPLGCLVHPWLSNREPRTTRTIAQKGRVSKYLHDQMQLQDPPSSSGFCSLRTESGDAEDNPWKAQAKRNLWVIATIAIMALNRLNFLAHPKRALLYQGCSLREFVGASSIAQNMVSITTDGFSDQESFALVGEKSDTECENESCGNSTEDIFRLIEKTPKTYNGPWPGQVGIPPKIALRKVVSGDVCSAAQAEPLETSKLKLPSRKKSLRKKLAGAFSNDKSARLAPVRKLSKRLTGKGDVSRENEARLGCKEECLEVAVPELKVGENGIDTLNFEEVQKDKSDTATRKHNKEGAVYGDNTGNLLSPITPQKSNW